jgi:hypothetical protein
MVNEVISWGMGVQVIFVVSEGAGEVRYTFTFIFVLSSLDPRI